jgi:type III pantothenate kinase
MFESLNKNTAQLPFVTESDYINMIGTSTKSSIASGVINSIAGLLEMVDNDLKNNRQADSVLFYTTGGNAEKINQYLTVKFEYVRELVLIGVNEIYKNNSGSD